MRPASMMAFERLSLLALAIAVLVAALTWERNVGPLLAQGVSQTMAIGLYAVVLALQIGLILWISRGRSNVAKWIYVVVMIAAVVLAIPALGGVLDRGIIGLAEVLQLLLQLGAVLLLFKRESSEWLSRTGPA